MTLRRRFAKEFEEEAVAPNLLGQDVAAPAPAKKRGADISCVWAREGWLCLAVVRSRSAR
jgi:putative transposase